MTRVLKYPYAHVPFIAELEYAKKAYEGRSEDIVPCIMCNRCHGTFMGPWFSVCTVNPELGLSPVARVIDIPSVSKKVAVIGGGPEGMKAAITAAERGHRVTVLTTAKKLVDDSGILTTSIMVDMYERMNDFSYVTEATTIRISKGKVTYSNAEGSEKSVNADSVVIYAGLMPK